MAMSQNPGGRAYAGTGSPSAVAMLLRQVGQQHFAHQGRALGVADHQDAVDDQRAVGLLVQQLAVQLVGDRQTEQVRDQRAVERGEQRGRHERAELGRVCHVGEHLHHADQGADHAEGRSAVADGAINLAALVEVHEEVVAVALEIVADEVEVIAVGDVADALGEEGLVGLDLFQTHRALLAGDLGDAGEFVDEVVRRQAAHGEGELGAERKAVQECRERKADHGGGDRAAEDDDHGMFGDEHVKVAAHEDHHRDHDDARNEPDARHDIHGILQRVRNNGRPGRWRGPTPNRIGNPRVPPLKPRKG
ncbi:hypothetical protein ABH985_002097 [Bradyrhizobium ottawaense]